MTIEKIKIESFESRKPEFEDYFNSLSFPSYVRKDIGFLSMAYSLLCLQSIEGQI